jgi:hypothetical protein
MKKRALVLLLISLTLSGCGSSGISQEDYDAVKTARDEAVAELSTVKAELAEAQKVETPAEDDVAVEKAAALSAAEAEYRAIGEIMRLAEKFTGTSADSVLTAYETSYNTYVSTLQDASSTLEITTYKSTWDEQVSNVYNTLASMDAPTQPAKTVSEASSGGEALYNDNDIIISYTGLEVDKSQIKFNFYVENNSDKDITVYLSDTAIDGYMVNVTCAIEVSAGKKANKYAFTYQKYLDENGLDAGSIAELEGNLKIKDETGGGYLEKEYPIKIEVQ